jgi:hypothetical protein
MKRPRPLSGPPETSGSTILRQIGLSFGIYITNNATARRFGYPETDLSKEPEPTELTNPLVLGSSLDVALTQLGIDLEPWKPPKHMVYRDQLSDAFSWAHTQLHQNNYVLMLMQGESLTNTAATTTTTTTTTSPNIQPLCWLMVDSLVEMRDGGITLFLHDGFDTTVHQRTSASMRLPSLHKSSNTQDNNHSHDRIDNDNNNNTNQERRHRVTRVTIPRSVPLTLRAIKGYTCPFVGDSSGNPFQHIHCQNSAHKQITVTVTIPNEQLNKNHTLYMFDNPKHIPERLEEYWKCQSIHLWHFALVFENTWSITVDVPPTGVAVFKCIETLIDPNVVKRNRAKTLRKKAQQFLKVGHNKTSNTKKQQVKHRTKTNQHYQPIKELGIIRRPVDSRECRSPKRSPHKLPSLTEVECLPKFMHPTTIHQGSKNSLFINERKKFKQEKTSLRVYVHIGDVEFVVNCGLGTQTVKWLALTAGQRYQTAKKGRFFKLPGHIVGTEATKIVVNDANNDKDPSPPSKFMSTGIQLNQWETDVSAAPAKRFKRVQQQQIPSWSTKDPAFQKKDQNNNARTMGHGQPLPGRAFTPEKGAEHRANKNKKAEKKAIAAAESRFKTLQLLSKNSTKKKKTRVAKRQFLLKLSKQTNQTHQSNQSTAIIKTETQAASKIQAIQRGRLRRRKLKSMNKTAGTLQAAFRGKKTRSTLLHNGDKVFHAIAEKREKKRKQTIIDSVTAKKKPTNACELNTASFGNGLGSKPNPFTQIRELLSDEAHCWVDLQTTITDEGDIPIVTHWMDKAYYGNKFAQRGQRLRHSGNSGAGKQAAYWASVMAQEKIKEAQQLLAQMDQTLNTLAPDLLFNVAQLVRKFSPRLTNFFESYLMLLNISEHDRIRAKNANKDLQLALALVGPRASDPIPSQKKVSEAFLLTLEGMKVASDLVPEACQGMPSLNDVGHPNFNALDLLKDSNKLHDLMHKICSVEWSSMNDEGKAFGIASQVEELKETVLDATNTGKRQGLKLRSWAEAASKMMGTRFGALTRSVAHMLDQEADQRASMSEFEKVWEQCDAESMIESQLDDEQDQNYAQNMYKTMTSVARHSFSHSKNVFQYFACIGGGVFDVSFSELMLFLKKSGAYDEHQQEMKINDISGSFKTTVRSKAADQRRMEAQSTRAGENETDLVGWSIIMLHLSLVRYGELFNGRWARAYQHFIDMHVIPMGLEVTGDEGTMRVALRSPEVISVMKKYAPVLQDVFMAYSNDDGELEMEDYVQLVTDAGLIDADLTRLECRRSFVRSQIAASYELEEQGLELDVIDENNGEDRSMDLDEFLASLPRLGCDKWDEGADGELPVYIKQEKISSAMNGLDPLSSIERRKKERRKRQVNTMP